MTSKVSNIRPIKERRDANDIVYTPLPIALKLIEMCQIQPNDRVLDPSKGKGVFFDNLPPCENKDWCEVTEGRDFFDYAELCDVVVGNPPFSKWKAWLEHSVKLGPRKIGYVMGVLNLTAIKLQFMRDSGYEVVSYHLASVRGWFANTILVVFEKGGIPILSFDTKRHATTEEFQLKTTTDIL